MQPIDISDLEPNGHYWALRDRFLSDEDTKVEIVQISTIFGTGPEYLSVAVLGSDQHYSVKDYLFLAKIEPPVLAQLR